MSCVLVGCLLLATVAISSVQGQFPNACVNKDSLKKRECCPVPNGFSKPCGTDGERGDCKELSVRQWSVTYDHYNTRAQLDDRHDWPRGVFKRSCKCRGNYAGYDCSKCKYGYRGNECKQKKVQTRKNFAKMSSEEQDTFMKYMNMSRYVQSDYSVSTAFYQEINETIYNGSDPTLSFRNVSIHELFVWLHYYTTNRNTVLPDETVLPYMDFAHEGQGFPTWHRLYLLSWERALQEMVGNDDYTIPFWDWTENSDKCEICTEELLGNTSANGDVVGKYFDDWNTICYLPGRNVTANDTKLCDPNVKTGKLKRAVGEQKTPNGNGVIVTFPTKKEVAFALRFETYDLPPFGIQASCSFRNILEGYANTTTGYSAPLVHFTLHNVVHIVIGGAMELVPSASNDPIFVLHHCFVDRILEKWLRKYKKDASVLSATEAPIGHNRDDVIVPMFPVHTHEEFFSESFSFGYDFEGIDKDGKSPDDEETEDASLGRCPVNGTGSKPAERVHDCIEWKIGAGVLAGLVFCLIIIIIAVTVSRNKLKMRVSEEQEENLKTTSST